MRRLIPTLAAASVLTLAACGDNNGNNTPTSDMTKPLDMGTPDMPDQSEMKPCESGVFSQGETVESYKARINQAIKEARDVCAGVGMTAVPYQLQENMERHSSGGNPEGSKLVMPENQEGFTCMYGTAPNDSEFQTVVVCKPDNITQKSESEEGAITLSIQSDMNNTSLPSFTINYFSISGSDLGLEGDWSVLVDGKEIINKTSNEDVCLVDIDEDQRIACVLEAPFSSKIVLKSNYKDYISSTLEVKIAPGESELFNMLNSRISTFHRN